MSQRPCRICQLPAPPVWRRRSARLDRDFTLHRCEACEKIILYKILKNLRFTRRGPLTAALSKALGCCCAWADRRYGVTAMPYAVAE
jgi:hypothetical protein